MLNSALPLNEKKSSEDSGEEISPTPTGMEKDAKAALNRKALPKLPTPKRKVSGRQAFIQR